LSDPAPFPTARPFAERHAVVTGAGRGTGAAIAAALAGQGARVTLMGRDPAPLEARAAALPDALVAPCDVTDEAKVEEAFRRAAAALGAPDILVNNAGAALSAPLAKTVLADFQAMLAVNLTGAFLCSRAVLPAMLAAGRGRIVNIASVAGLKGFAYVSAYCAAKHGLIGLTRALAVETAAKGVTVNAVCPGYTETDMVKDAVANISAKTGRGADEARAELVKANPQGRLVRPEEVAAAVTWLCGPDTAAVTGQAIAVAGGEAM
jgi:NAD(P)-dependent dehydrogenase (short-subunit alcohol dehydrogenase family)